MTKLDKLTREQVDSAWIALYPTLIRFLRKQFPHDPLDDHADAVSNAYLRVRNAAIDREKFSSYCHRAVRNAMVDIMRRRKSLSLDVMVVDNEPYQNFLIAPDDWGAIDLLVELEPASHSVMSIINSTHKHQRQTARRQIARMRELREEVCR